MQTLPPLVRAIALITGLATLASCSDRKVVDAAPVAGEQTRVFSETEKLAARKLSMGSSTAFNSAAGPYEQAVLCNSAIQALAERFNEVGGAGEVQVRAIAQAQAIFARQVQTLGRSEGKSAAAIQSDVEEASQNGAQMSAQAQLAVTCVQRLQT